MDQDYSALFPPANENAGTRPEPGHASGQHKGALRSVESAPTTIPSPAPTIAEQPAKLRSKKAAKPVNPRLFDDPALTRRPFIAQFIPCAGEPLRRNGFELALIRSLSRIRGKMLSCRSSEVVSPERPPFISAELALPLGDEALCAKHLADFAQKRGFTLNLRPADQALKLAVIGDSGQFTLNHLLYAALSGDLKIRIPMAITGTSPTMRMMLSLQDVEWRDLPESVAALPPEYEAELSAGLTSGTLDYALWINTPTLPSQAFLTRHAGKVLALWAGGRQPQEIQNAAAQMTHGNRILTAHSAWLLPQSPAPPLIDQIATIVPRGTSGEHSNLLLQEHLTALTQTTLRDLYQGRLHLAQKTSLFAL